MRFSRKFYPWMTLLIALAILLVAVSPMIYHEFQMMLWTHAYARDLTKIIARYYTLSSTNGSDLKNIATGRALQLAIEATKMRSGPMNLTFWTDYRKVLSYTDETAYVEIIYHLEGIERSTSDKEEKIGDYYWTIFYLIKEDGKWKVADNPGVCPPPPGEKHEICINEAAREYHLDRGFRRVCQSCPWPYK